MSKSKFVNGDVVEVVEGEFKGYRGEVYTYDETFDVYLVMVPELSKTHYLGMPESYMAFVTPDSEDRSKDVVPRFGMSGVRLAAYADSFIEGVLGRLISE